MTIQTVQLRSSMLLSATYDDENEELSLTFSNGATYDYHDVPKETFEALAQASSAGRYWHSFIKDQYT